MVLTMTLPNAMTPPLSMLLDMALGMQLFMPRARARKDNMCMAQYFIKRFKLLNFVLKHLLRMVGEVLRRACLGGMLNAFMPCSKILNLTHFYFLYNCNDLFSFSIYFFLQKLYFIMSLRSLCEGLSSLAEIYKKQNAECRMPREETPDRFFPSLC